MKKHGKVYRSNLAKIDRSKRYTLEEGLTLIAGFATRKCDETINVSFNLGVDPRQSDQMVRGATTLPHGIGKTVKVLVIARGEAEAEAKQAGAEFVGNDDLIEKIEKGWLDFDRALTTPDCLKDMTRVAKILGPRGLMPNKKTGTVTSEIGKAVADQKKGKVEYKTEKAGIVHALIGKRSFGVDKLKENFMSLYQNLLRQKPASSKGTYIRKISVAPTHGPGLFLDVAQLELSLKAMA